MVSIVQALMHMVLVQVLLIQQAMVSILQVLMHMVLVQALLAQQAMVFIMLVLELHLRQVMQVITSIHLAHPYFLALLQNVQQQHNKLMLKWQLKLNSQDHVQVQA